MRALENESGERFLIEAAQRDPRRFADLYKQNFARVDAGGRPQQVQISRSLGMGLDEKAIAAVRSWRFTPAMKDGRPVAVQINVEVNFRLY